MPYFYDYSDAIRELQQGNPIGLIARQGSESIMDIKFNDRARFTEQGIEALTFALEQLNITELSIKATLTGSEILTILNSTPKTLTSLSLQSLKLSEGDAANLSTFLKHSKVAELNIDINEFQHVASELDLVNTNLETVWLRAENEQANESSYSIIFEKLSDSKAKEMHIIGLDLTSDNLASIDITNSLEKIRLFDCEVDSSTIEMLAKHESLSSIVLQGTHLDETALTELNKLFQASNIETFEYWDIHSSLENLTLENSSIKHLILGMHSAPMYDNQPLTTFKPDGVQLESITIYPNHDNELPFDTIKHFHALVENGIAENVTFKQWNVELRGFDEFTINHQNIAGGDIDVNIDELLDSAPPSHVVIPQDNQHSEVYSMISFESELQPSVVEL